ncbi:Tad domain-containing protein [Roseomonas sp. NAR14]|uniref:Tad domain-containing protein n=1 Tax=Roseomonas acroporae TaxID=2937791 RepID=A0A9X2BUP7_9PROT|nr:Tad domain-containing protein [Roseomonas acroporae]MCK8785742.1 Tad domain-containing protein [Roseomonas acroporae]
MRPLWRLRRLPACRRGGVAAIVAAAAVPLMLMVGLATDLARLYLLQSRLVAATDVAALAGARAIFDPDRDTQVRNWFWANFTRDPASANRGYLGAVVAPADFVISTDSDNKVLRVRARATLPTGFMRLAGIQTMTAAADQSAQRQDRGMELAMVLDVTGSMSDSAGSGQGSKIAALRNAATELINTLFGNNASLPNLWVSLVPYTTTVNIGRSHAGWLASGSYRAADFSPTVWRGCVEARSGGEDMTDTPPTTAPFRPFLWTSTRNRYAPWVGDNEWPTTSGTVTEANPESPKSDSQQHPNEGVYEVGPNVGCERALTAMAQAKATLLAEIAALRAGPDRGGTITNQGLQWGWATLSPRWNGLWGVPNMPLPYNTLNMDKVLILLTDGINDLADWSGGAPGSCTVSGCSGARPATATNPDSDYTAYGRMSENRLRVGTVSKSSYLAEFNRRTSVLCESIKAAGIRVYTITFALTNATTQNMFRNCASRPDYYFNSPDAAALQAAFREIAQQLANLRLVR